MRFVRLHWQFATLAGIQFVQQRHGDFAGRQVEGDAAALDADDA